MSKVSDLQEFIYVEDLIEKGVRKVDACKLLKLVGGVRYRPMEPDKAVSANADARVQQSSGSGEARTLSQVREADGRGEVNMPRGS